MRILVTGGAGFIGSHLCERLLDDPTQRQPVIKLAHDKLNWHPRINLIEGLKKTITYFREKLNITESNSAAA